MPNLRLLPTGRAGPQAIEINSAISTADKRMTSGPVDEPLVFVDLETTGANFANDRIIEIGIVSVDRGGAHEWSSLINPEQAVSGFITQLTGIDTAMVATAPTFAQLASEIAQRLRGRLFIAHNARFDYTFLQREFARLGTDFRAPSLCTVKLSRKLFPAHHKHNLDTLVSRFGITVTDRHRALADARVLWALWQRWHGMLPISDIRSAVDTIVGRPDLPAHIDAELIDDIPEAPGAYALLDENDTVLLVKRGTNLRKQVVAHFAPAKRETALVRNTWGIKWREAAGEFGARLYEHALSATSRKTAKDLCAWQLIQHGEGDFRPGLVHADQIDFGRTQHLYGLYASPREATLALRKLAEAHHLCNDQLDIYTVPKQAGEACVAYRQKTCRGLCVGKESVALHSARLMSALAKLKLDAWPYAGPVALIERDVFGMREDFHLFDHWHYLGTSSNEVGLYELLDNRCNTAFDPDIYRIASKHLRLGKLRLLALLKPSSPTYAE